MKSNNQHVLISGASIAGLSAAWWMKHLGYTVTVVELAGQARVTGAAVDIREDAVAVVKRMGIYDYLKANQLGVDRITFKNAADQPQSIIELADHEQEEDQIEIERDKFIGHLYDQMKGTVDFRFNTSVTDLEEGEDSVLITFKDGRRQTFDLVLGCDGSHSNIRKLWFGPEADYAHFMEAYFAISTIDKLLIPKRTMEMYNEPCKCASLNSYNGKTDIIFMFASENEIPYSYKDQNQQEQIIKEQFNGLGWRTQEMLNEVSRSGNFYFDKFCQVKMPSWTKGRVALIGDAGYCASPAAGMGASLSVVGAAALADALQKSDGQYEKAFAIYNSSLRPFVERVQTSAVKNIKESFIPRTEEEIQYRNVSGQF